MNSDFLTTEYLKRTDPASQCFVELHIHDADNNGISYGVHASINEAMYHVLCVLRDSASAVATQITKRESRNGWKPSDNPPHRFSFRCVHKNARCVRSSSRFDRARLNRVLPTLSLADWSGKDNEMFRMKRPRRKNTGGKRFAKRDPFLILSLKDIEKRLCTRWYYRNSLIVTINK
jgi:hypothetical protein